jgi:ribosomal protein S12 methylthiotransferase accessory factor
MKIVLQDRECTSINESSRRADSLVGNISGIIKGVSEMPCGHDSFGLFSFRPEIPQVSVFSRVAHWSPGSGGGKVCRDSARMSAVGEALERYCSALYDDNSLYFGSYVEFRDYAVNPGDFVLFSKRQYQQDGFWFPEFSETNMMGWVEGYSLTEQKEVLVPAHLVYLPYKRKDNESALCESVSTGTACGSSLEEAILKGIYEVVERDAFMIMWLNGLPMPDVIVESSKNEETLKLLERISNSNLSLYVKYITNDIDIPIFLGILTDKSGVPPVLAVGACANLNAEQALLSAIEESITTRMWAKILVNKNPHYIYDESTPDNIKDFDDHVLLYGKVDLRTNVPFLFDFNTSVSMEKITKDASTSVKKNIEKCVEILEQKNLNVILSDITTTDIRDAGFFVTKTLIPGAHPLNGAYDYRCLGGRRLYQVPVILGYRTNNITDEELNKYPHPFP